jgi:hypothetical protein
MFVTMAGLGIGYGFVSQIVEKNSVAKKIVDLGVSSAATKKAINYAGPKIFGTSEWRDLSNAIHDAKKKHPIDVEATVVDADKKEETPGEHEQIEECPSCDVYLLKKDFTSVDDAINIINAAGYEVYPDYEHTSMIKVELHHVDDRPADVWTIVGTCKQEVLDRHRGALNSLVADDIHRFNDTDDLHMKLTNTDHEFIVHCPKIFRSLR